MKRLYIKQIFGLNSILWAPRTAAGSPTAQPNEGLVQNSKSHRIPFQLLWFTDSMTESSLIYLLITQIKTIRCV